ncbi:uncharacterized protein EV154DRAFT_487240 [Mucor mucedo]|uniref:uncharacterized protein n=1 Tax=Mucor mucedo TaxID=29922 RepID=UPI0022202EB2|nr:uncharacterized protein EV154DRAFT_487240 [Mucor mucedo]KAI7873366.1 hypothetical protein EV154DRAFT_487240 [Mucor mucedo]
MATLNVSLEDTPLHHLQSMAQRPDGALQRIMNDEIQFRHDLRSSTNFTHTLTNALSDQQTTFLRAAFPNITFKSNPSISTNPHALAHEISVIQAAALRRNIPSGQRFIDFSGDPSVHLFQGNTDFHVCHLQRDDLKFGVRQFNIASKLENRRHHSTAFARGTPRRNRHSANPDNTENARALHEQRIATCIERYQKNPTRYSCDVPVQNCEFSAPFAIGSHAFYSHGPAFAATFVILKVLSVLSTHFTGTHATLTRLVSTGKSAPAESVSATCPKTPRIP